MLFTSCLLSEPLVQRASDTIENTISQRVLLKILLLMLISSMMDSVLLIKRQDFWPQQRSVLWILAVKWSCKGSQELRLHFLWRKKLTLSCCLWCQRIPQDKYPIEFRPKTSPARIFFIKKAPFWMWIDEQATAVEVPGQDSWISSNNYQNGEYSISKFKSSCSLTLNPTSQKCFPENKASIFSSRKITFYGSFSFLPPALVHSFNEKGPYFVTGFKSHMGRTFGTSFRKTNSKLVRIYKRKKNNEK